MWVSTGEYKTSFANLLTFTFSHLEEETIRNHDDTQSFINQMVQQGSQAIRL